MLPRILGEHPLARDAAGRLKSRIATVFPLSNALVTLPGIHATQRMAHVDAQARQRADLGLSPLSRDEEIAEWRNSVDLIIEDDLILIRPDPDNMALSFRADEILQNLVPKHRIKFLLVRDGQVRRAIKQRGECWRISPLPKTTDEMKQMIVSSRIAIGGEELYYYSKATGTRLLTYEAFARLATFGEQALREHLLEIQKFSAGVNVHGNREVAFFMANAGFSKEDFRLCQFEGLEGPALRAVYEGLRCKFAKAVPIEFQRDDVAHLDWRNHMYASLIGQDEKSVSEERLLGLSSEFFMQIEWLPGGRIEEGELIFDSVFETAEETRDPELLRLCDEKCRNLMFNFVREYANLEYVNIGRVVRSLSQRTESAGRRDVYIIQIKQCGVEEEIVKIVRMQKWGVREHLDEGKRLLDAIVQSEEYTEYVLDRRLGCRQLGMNLPARTNAKRMSEPYQGLCSEVRNGMIWSPYFERDYIRGMASDKIPPEKLADPAFAARLARLLGQAAASNMIVGRCGSGNRVVFDDGDEIVIENDAGLPVEIIVADHTGTFADFRSDLRSFIPEYAAAVTRRLPDLTDPEEFATLYVEAFVSRFSHIQLEYRKRKQAFDRLFRHRPRDEAGSFAYRWECVLDRLRQASAGELGELLKNAIASGVVPR